MRSTHTASEGTRRTIGPIARSGKGVCGFITYETMSGSRVVEIAGVPPAAAGTAAFPEATPASADSIVRGRRRKPVNQAVWPLRGQTELRFANRDLSKLCRSV